MMDILWALVLAVCSESGRALNIVAFLDKLDGIGWLKSEREIGGGRERETIMICSKQNCRIFGSSRRVLRKKTKIIRE